MTLYGDELSFIHQAVILYVDKLSFILQAAILYVDELSFILQAMTLYVDELSFILQVVIQYGDGLFWLLISSLCCHNAQTMRYIKSNQLLDDATNCNCISDVNDPSALGKQ